MTDSRGQALNKSRLKEKELCDNVRNSLVGFTENMRRFLTWKDDMLANSAIDKAFQQSLAVSASQVYLAKLQLEAAVVGLVEYTVKGIEQQSNQEIWFSDKTAKQPASSAAAARDRYTGGGGFVNWVRIAAKIKARLAVQRRTQLLTNMARQLALEEARVTQVKQEYESFQRLAGAGAAALAPARNSGSTLLFGPLAARAKAEDIDFSRPLISMDDDDNADGPRTSAPHDAGIGGMRSSARSAGHVRSKAHAAHASHQAAATGVLKSSKPHKDKTSAVQRTISFANAIAESSMSSFAGASFAANASSYNTSAATSGHTSMHGAESNRVSAGRQSATSDRSDRSSPRKSRPNKGGATGDAQNPRDSSIMASMDDDGYPRRASDIRGRSHSGAGGDASPPSTPNSSDRGLASDADSVGPSGPGFVDDQFVDDGASLAKPAFTTAANFEGLDDLLLHRSDDQELKKIALKRRTGEAAQAVEGVFQGQRGATHTKQGRRGSSLMVGSALPPIGGSGSSMQASMDDRESQGGNDYGIFPGLGSTGSGAYSVGSKGGARGGPSMKKDRHSIYGPPAVEAGGGGGGGTGGGTGRAR